MAERVHGVERPVQLEIEDSPASLSVSLITDNACAYCRNEILHIVEIEDSYR
jgi:hypothetical protein